MTLTEAKNLTIDTTLYHRIYTNADGTPARYRVNGQVKTWKTRPNEVRVPLKRGLYEHGYLNHHNLGDFFFTEEEAMDPLKKEASA